MQVFLGLGQPLKVTRLMLLNTRKPGFDIENNQHIVAVIGSAVLVRRSAFVEIPCSLHTS